jgi:hypothetical protein
MTKFKQSNSDYAPGPESYPLCEPFEIKQKFH